MMTTAAAPRLQTGDTHEKKYAPEDVLKHAQDDIVRHVLLDHRLAADAKAVQWIHDEYPFLVDAIAEFHGRHPNQPFDFDAVERYTQHPPVRKPGDYVVNDKAVALYILLSVSYTHLTLPTIYSV